ncbi:Hypothetical Protein FCC1311_011832 [Hondaea fermentalgiana]|uniref:Uncharacterized protein n=1 Tax=Hondaea fermentalgiana TaxID=2315210 RepID=A0A2R5G1S3_9STRA|nr:Hypothetical Protein FCC1311_011832 [Hondaea fermentalgiana]|eukprot:GBG24966.1 Hypothetical Protein FCC1311_011832 [Hondaea fermentalgiana]
MKVPRRKDPFAVRNEVFADGTGTGPGPQPWHLGGAASPASAASSRFKGQSELETSRSTNANNTLSLAIVPQDWVVATAEAAAAQADQRERRKIKANPGAAEVWLAERRRGAPWRERAERLQQVEDEKAKREHAVKRVTLLAKQTCAGIKSVYGIRYDPSELAPLISDAIKEMQKPNHTAESALLVKAVQSYDLKAVCRILGLHVTASASDPPPNLSILSKPPVRPKP